MKRDLLIGLLVALVLHGGLALSGDFFKATPAPVPVDDAIPVIELAPPPAPPEPETVDLREPSAEGGGGDLPDLVPAMQADTPSPTASSFLQQIQPPPPPGLIRSSGPIIPLGRPGPGIGTGTGGGLQNLFDLASLDEDPVPRVRVEPVYPHEMSRSGINGHVMVGLVVDSEGNVLNPYVIDSSHREFEAAALRAITRWKFKPGRKNGANVGTSNVQLRFNFTLRNN